MIKTLQYLLLLVFVASAPSCASQDQTAQTPSDELGTVVSELPERLWSVYQDQSDNYWFGSNGGGVFRFDGEQLVQFTTETGLVDNSIRGIQGDLLGNVFIQTPSGVSKFDGQSFTTLMIDRSHPDDWKLEPEDLWFNCNGSPTDVYRYDGEQLYELKLPRKNLIEAFGVHIQGLSFTDMNSSPYSVFGINKDSKGNLWIGTVTAGAFRYDGTAFLWVAEPELTTLPSGRVPGVRSMIEDKDGNMWLSNFKNRYAIQETEQGLSYEKRMGVDTTGELFEEYLPYFNSAVKDADQNLWMTSYGGGVWKYDGNELQNIPIWNGNKKVLIVSMYADKQGVIWLGTDNDGVYKAQGETFVKYVPVLKN